MNDKTLEELRQYFTGYGSPHDELIIRLIKEYRLSIEEIYQHLEDKEELEQQNKRYREALEFYADERNYEERDFGIIKQNAIQEGDKGNTARKALEESK